MQNKIILKKLKREYLNDTEANPIIDMMAEKIRRNKEAMDEYTRSCVDNSIELEKTIEKANALEQPIHLEESMTLDCNKNSIFSE